MLFAAVAAITASHVAEILVATGGLMCAVQTVVDISEKHD